jgi:hypothetical protein
MQGTKKVNASTQKTLFISIGVTGILAAIAIATTLLTGHSPLSIDLSGKQKLFPIYSNQKVGYMDQQGKVVINPQFDVSEDSSEFSEGLAAAQVKKKWGFIDETGKFVIQPQYDSVRQFSNGLAVVFLKDQVSYIDKSGKTIFQVPPEQGSIVSDFSEGLAPVKLGQRWGYIDQSGKYAINPQFEVNIIGVFSGGLAMMMIGGKVGYIDRAGKMVIPPQYRETAQFSQGLAPVLKGDQWGFIDKSGKFIIQPQYDALLGSAKARGWVGSDFPEGWVGFSEGLTPVKVGNVWGYIDQSGKLVINPQFEEAQSFSEGLAAIKLGDRWGYIDKSGKIIINPQYGEAEDFSNGLAFIPDQQGGYIDRTGRFVWIIKDPNYISPQNYAAQEEAVMHTAFINRSQQAYYSQRGQFTSNLSNFDYHSLKGNNLETVLLLDEHYSYNMIVIGQGRMRLQAIPKHSGLKSYASSAVVNSDGVVLMTICQSDEPSQQALNPPQMQGSQLKCSPGSSRF